jgi:oligopeptide transport system substrate-binding protein
MLRLLVIPLALLVLLAGAMIWSGGSVQSKPDFTFINRGEIGTLDPNRMSWLQDIRVGYALWEGLYTLDAQTLDPIPGSAGRIDVSDDKTVYTFHIRPEAQWSNGDDLVATDFVFAWRRMLEQPGDYSYLFDYIKGCKTYGEAFAARSNPDFTQVGIEALDRKTLRVTLKFPLAFFPDLCAFPPFFPLHEKSMQPFAEAGIDGRVRYGAGFTRPPHLVTNGPYRLDTWEFKRTLRMVASDFYWDRANVKSRVIDMLSFEDTQTAFLKYESGGVDWLAEVTSEAAAEMLEQGGRPDFHVFPGFGTYFYSINCLPKLPDGRPNPLADVRVRQALSLAINKEPIVKTIMRIGQPVADTYVPRGVFTGYQSPPGLTFNVDKARQLLADAGYPNGKGFPRLTLLYNNEGDHKYIAQNVCSQWAKNIGIDIVTEGVEIKTFRKRLHDKQYELARASWIGDYNDPSTFTDKYLSTSDNNDAGWVSAEYDQLCADAAVELDPQKRLRLLERAEGILLAEAPILPIYVYVNVYMFPPNVRGVPLNPRNMVIFKGLEKVK